MAEDKKKDIAENIDSMLQAGSAPNAMPSPAPAENAEPAADGGLLAEADAEAAQTPETEKAPETQPEKTEPAEPDKPAETPQQDEDSVPITDWAKTKSKLQMPDGFPIDQDTLEKFGKVAVESGLSRKQAQQLVNWQTQIIADARQQQLEQGAAELQKAWGDNSETYRNQTLEFISKIDRAMDGDCSFSKALSDSGADMNPDMIKCLFRISQMVSEDSFGAGKAGASADNKKLSIEEMLNQAAEKQKLNGGGSVWAR